MIDHISLGVTGLGRARRFHDATLGALGVLRCDDGDHFSSYQRQGSDDFSIHETTESAAGPHKAHFAFGAPNRDSVDRFHRTALAAGGADDGAPGLRPQYHADFVGDPDGNRPEAICHAAP